MKLRFLVDAQLPPALADQLSARGYDGEHVARVGLGAATDKEFLGVRGKNQAGPDQQRRRICISRLAEPNRTASSLGSRREYDKPGIVAGLENVLPEILQALGERVIEIIGREKT